MCQGLQVSLSVQQPTDARAGTPPVSAPNVATALRPVESTPATPARWQAPARATQHLRRQARTSTCFPKVSTGPNPSSPPQWLFDLGTPMIFEGPHGSLSCHQVGACIHQPHMGSGSNLGRVRQAGCCLAGSFPDLLVTPGLGCALCRSSSESMQITWPGLYHI